MTWQTFFLGAGSIAVIVILLVVLSANWVGAGCDAHLDMADNEKRCRR